MFLTHTQPKPHLILLVGDEGILCVPYNIPRAPMPFFADPADKNIGTMLALASRYPRIPVTFLADTLAQDIRRDTLPHLNLFDRARLVRRRLQQAFPQARLTASLPVKSDRTQMLLAALQGGSALFDWLGRFAAARPARPPHISLLPLEGTGMLAKLLPQAAEGWCLMLSRQRTGGFRQIVTHDGELIFTRLTPPLPNGAKPAEIAALIARDIQATRGYLGRLGLNERAPLPAILLISDSCQDELGKIALPVHAPLLLSPYEAALKLGLPFAPAIDDPYSDLLFASWFLSQKFPRCTLIPSEMKQTQRTLAIRRLGLRTAVATFLLSLGLAGWDASDLASTFIERQKEAAQLDTLEQKLAAERSAAAPVTEPMGRLREALERQRLFNTTLNWPWTALRLADSGLGAEARLVKFEWHNDSGMPANENLRIKARLTGQPDISDREVTVAQFRQIAQNLSQAMPDYAVEVARYPFPALPREALSNEKTPVKNASADATAEFSIRRVTP